MPSKRQQYDRAGRTTKSEQGWFPTIDPATGKPCHLVQFAVVSFTPPTKATDIPSLLDEIEQEASKHPRKNHLNSYCQMVNCEIERIREHLKFGLLDSTKIGLTLYRLGHYVERMRAEISAKERADARSPDQERMQQLVDECDRMLEVCCQKYGKPLTFAWDHLRKQLPISKRTYFNYRKKIQK